MQVLMDWEKLTIALDFDDTFTAAPSLWTSFINSSRFFGHTVICVTSRRDTPENREELERAFAQWHIDIAIWFCNLNPKIKEMKKRDIKVDIWIDDNPLGITEGY